MSELVEQVKAALGRVTPHPVVPFPSDEDLLVWLEQPGGVEEFLAWHQERERQIVLEKADPFHCRIEPATWKLADRQLAELDASTDKGGVVLYLSGRNRVGKSWYAHKRAVQALMQYPDIEILFLSETEDSSKMGQQKIVWDWLPNEIKALNGKQTEKYKVKWSRANGFADEKLIVPSGGIAYFSSYRSDPGKWEGFEFGSRKGRCIAVVADENMPMAWAEMVERRAKYRNGIVLWCYTPVQGITPVIKDWFGSQPKPLEWARAPMLPDDRSYVTGLPPGHMPTVAQSLTKRYARAVYFHNMPYGDYAAQVAQDCEGKPSEYVMRMAYGWAQDVGGRVLASFGPNNIIEPEELPAVGTNYQLVDPAGARPWATIWVRVAPGNPAKLYVYRDWPDLRTHGEWAVTTARATTEGSKKGWDGDPGPAYHYRPGYGPHQYKKVWLEAETVRDGERDPYRARLKAKGQSADGAEVREVIAERYGDPRAMATPQATDRGAVTIFDTLAQPWKDKDGRELAPAMYFIPVPVREGATTQLDEGLNLLNDLLYWDKSQPLMPMVNEPRLYVSRECEQVIWAMDNYTGLGGSTAPTKDWIDLLSYMAFADLRYIAPQEGARARAWGGY